MRHFYDYFVSKTRAPIEPKAVNMSAAIEICRDKIVKLTTVRVKDKQQRQKLLVTTDFVLNKILRRDPEGRSSNRCTTKAQKYQLHQLRGAAKTRTRKLPGATLLPAPQTLLTLLAVNLRGPRKRRISTNQSY